MAQVVLGTVGASVLGPVGAVLGRGLGAAIENRLVASLMPVRQSGPRIEALRVQGTAEGAPLPFVLGRMRVTGQVIWAARFMESRHRARAGKGGQRIESHSYSISLAISLCEGEIDAIGRIWADGKPFDASGVSMRLYRGTPDQMPDATLIAVEGAAPAYRDLAYVVFEDLPLERFGNRVPQFSFEVLRRARTSEPQLEDRIEGVCLIPGAGEFALATTPVLRREGLTRVRAENVNNATGRSDALVSLDQLLTHAPNLKRVNVVVGWFGSDLRAGHCTIRPGVERRDKTTEPLSWSVAGLDRFNAHLISESGGGPAYGGTPSDDSVREMIAALKVRGLEVTLYPFLFMDIPADNTLPDPYGGPRQGAYPWRGRITGQDGAAQARSDVEHIFGTSEGWGLRRMARHYAALALECGADGLLIGSEMRALTRLRDEAGAYPAVEALCALAQECSDIAGPGVAISYAADWSEYYGHHPGGGEVRFHLDPLWAHPAIDHVGIDWYAPMGDWRDGSDHLDALAGYRGAGDPDYLAAQVRGGEGFDWFYADDEARAAQLREPITDGAYGEPWVWRVKDLASWWGHTHFERPGGVRAASPTPWVPGMKPIRLYEVGCAAIDRGANAPNRFLDPKSAETALPPFSNGARDDRMQRRTIEAVLDQYGRPELNPLSPHDGRPMIAGIDLWCWDARPWPDFPARESVWADAPNWSRGHWLNGRLGSGAMIASVMARHGLSDDEVDVERGLEAPAGFVISHPMRGRDALAPLLAVAGASVVEQGGRLRVVADDVAGESIESEALVLADDGPLARLDRRTQVAPGVVRVRFHDEGAQYQTGSVLERSDGAGRDGGVLDVDLAVACDEGLARQVAREVLMSEEVRERLHVRPGPLHALRLECGDAVSLLGRRWRIARIDSDGQPRWELRPEPPERARRQPGRFQEGDAPEASAAPFALVLDLPEKPAVLRAAAALEPWREQAIHLGGAPEDLSERARVMRPATLGTLVAPLAPGRAGRWHNAGEIEVYLEGTAPQSLSRAGVLGGGNRLAVEAGGSWEILQFEQVTALGPGLYRLSGLLRGLAGSEIEAEAGAPAGARVVVLDDAIVPVAISPAERGVTRLMRAGPGGLAPGGPLFTEAMVTWQALGLRPLRPSHLKARRTSHGLKLSWSARALGDTERLDGTDGEAIPAAVVRVRRAGAMLRQWSVSGTGMDYAEAELEADGGASGLEIGVCLLDEAWGEGPEQTLRL